MGDRQELNVLSDIINSIESAIKMLEQPGNAAPEGLVLSLTSLRHFYFLSYPTATEEEFKTFAEKHTITAADLGFDDVVESPGVY
jgi:hypothetical protein